MVTLVHDPGVAQALDRLHDVHLFDEAAARLRADDAGVYADDFANATRDVLDDLAIFREEVRRWSAERVEAAQAASAEADAAADLAAEISEATA